LNAAQKQSNHERENAMTDNDDMPHTLEREDVAELLGTSTREIECALPDHES
jgi:hypothetical protein